MSVSEVINWAKSCATMWSASIQSILNLFGHFPWWRALLRSSVLTLCPKEVRIKLALIVVAGYATCMSSAHPACHRFCEVRSCTWHFRSCFLRFRLRPAWFRPIFLHCSVFHGRSTIFIASCFNMMGSWRETLLLDIIAYTTHSLDPSQSGAIDLPSEHVRIRSTVGQQRDRECACRFKYISLMLASCSVTHLALVLVKILISAATTSSFTATARICQPLN